MKKKLLVVLAAAAVFASSAFFASCGGNSSDSSSSAASSESFLDSSTPSPSAVIPEGYAKFEDEYISFAYPSSWSSEADSELYALENEELTVAVAKFTDVEKNNFIAAMYTAKTGKYENLTTEAYRAPMEEALGITFEECSVEQKSKGETKITKIYYKIDLFGLINLRTFYYLTSGDRTYCVDISETDEPVEGLTDTVYDTLLALK